MWKVWNKGILCLKQNWFNEITIVTSIYIPFYIYCNFRSFTHTADYPHRPIIAYGEKKVNRLPARVDNLHVMLLNFLVAKMWH